MKRKLSFLLLSSLLVLLSGCTITDPYPEDAYFGDIYSHGVLLGAGGGDMFKATYDPANIGEQLVGLTAAQSLTNKQLLMNNGDAIRWKTFAGAPQETLNLLASNILQLTNPSGAVQILGGGINLNYNVDEDIYLWGGTIGSGRELVLYGGYATAGSVLKDSPTLNMAASYWDAGAAVGWPGTILHDMITAGAAPKSQLKLAINGASILRLENDNGTVKAYSDGNLSMVNSAIDMSQVGVEPTSTANKAGIYAIDLSPGNCTIGFNTETVVQVAIGVASTNRIPVRWNEATYYLLAEASGFYSPLVGTVKPTVEQGLRVGLVFLNMDTYLWERCASISPVTWETLPTGSASVAWGDITGTLSEQTDLQGVLDAKLSAVTGTSLDNVFSSNGLLKRTGAGTYMVDTSAYLTGNQTITLSGDASGSGTTSISVTNTGLRSVSVPALSTGYLYYNGSSFGWQTPSSGSYDPIATLDMYDEFASGLLTTGNIGSLGWGFTGTAPTVIASVVNHNGIRQIPTTTVSANISAMWLGGAVNTDTVLYTDYCDMTFIVRMTDVTSDTAFVGAMDAMGTAVGNQDRYGFEYIDSSDTYWMMVTGNGTFSTRTATDIVVAINTWYKLRVVRNGSGVNYYIDGISKGAVATTLPDTSLNIGLHIQTNTTAAKYLQVDIFRMTLAETR